jgi:malonate transporter
LEVLSVLADPILPVFAIMAFGYFMGWFGKTTVEQARVINQFAMSILLPILIFGLIARAPIHEFSIVPASVYLGCEALIFTVGFLLARKLFKCGPGESVLLGFTSIFSNVAFYVLPISILLYGAENVLPVTAVVTLDSTITFASAIVTLQLIKMGQVSIANVGITILRSPILQAIIAGVVVSLARIPIPEPVLTFIEFNGSAAAPVALFALGVVLSQTKFTAQPIVLVFSLVKLGVFPIAVWLGLSFFSDGDISNDMFLLASAGPSGAMAFSMALLYGVRTERITQIIIWTSLSSLITLALLA